MQHQVLLVSNVYKFNAIVKQFKAYCTHVLRSCFFIASVRAWKKLEE